MNMFIYQQKTIHDKINSGFTFIEILVVTVLVVLLSTIAMVSYRQAGTTTRDARRIQDVKNIQAALEFYKQVNGGYPASANCSGVDGYDRSTCGQNWLPGLDDEYLDQQPHSPQESSLYYYAYFSDNPSEYTLYAALEDTKNANSADLGWEEDNLYVLEEPK